MVSPGPAATCCALSEYPDRRIKGAVTRVADVLLLALWINVPCAAEPIDVPTRPSERPLGSPGFLQDTPADGLIVPSVPETPAEAGDQTARLRVDAIAFEGNRVLSSEELDAIARPFVGRELSISDIEQLRELVTRHYIDKGYINSGAVLAEDAYRDGKLSFTLVEGHIEQVRVAGQERLRKSYIQDRLKRDNEPFNVKELQERFQLLLADPLFAKLNARVLPGMALGEAILDVEVQRAVPYQLTLFANNYRPPSIGAEAYGASGWVRNLTSFGDVLDVLYQDGRGGPRYGAGWSVPVNSYGTLVEARYDQGHSTLIEEPLADIDIQSEFKSLEFGISHPLIDRPGRRFVLGLSWANRESTSTIAGVPFSFVPGEVDGRTELHVWRFSQDLQQRWEQSVLSVRSTFSFGHNNISQDQVAATTPQRHFRVWLGQLQYVHRLMDNGTQALLRGFIQTSSDRLVPLERTAIGGVSTVRGYRENHLVRDKGYAISAELHVPALGPPSPRRAADLIAFVDHGAARNQDEASEHLSSVGLGVNGRYEGFSAELYVAKRLNKPPGDTGSNLQDKGIHLQISYAIF